QGEPLPASFQLVSQPEEVDPTKARKEELREIRQEAVVKGITPAQPAPLPIARTASTASDISTKALPGGDMRAGSWLSKMLSWFKSEPETPAAEAPSHRRTEAPAKPEKRQPPATAVPSAAPVPHAEGEERREGGRRRRGRRGRGGDRAERAGTGTAATHEGGDVSVETSTVPNIVAPSTSPAPEVETHVPIEA